MDKEKKSITLSFKVTPSFKKRLKERAKEEDRSLSNLVEKILKDYLTKIEEAKKIINQ